MKKVVVFLVLILTVVFLTAPVFAESTKTIVLSVEGGWGFGGDSVRTAVQQAIYNVLRQNGFNVIVQSHGFFGPRDLPYPLLEIKPQIDRGPITQPLNIGAGGFGGSYSSQPNKYHDLVSVVATLYSQSGYNQAPLTSAMSSAEVKWQQGATFYSGPGVSVSQRSNREKALQKAAVKAALEALAQLDFSAAAEMAQEIPENSGNSFGSWLPLPFPEAEKNIETPVPPVTPYPMPETLSGANDVLSFLERERQKGGKVNVNIAVKDGKYIISIVDRYGSYRYGSGRTLEEAFRNAK